MRGAAAAAAAGSAAAAAALPFSCCALVGLTGGLGSVRSVGAAPAGLQRQHQPLCCRKVQLQHHGHPPVRQADSEHPGLGAGLIQSTQDWVRRQRRRQQASCWHRAGRCGCRGRLLPLAVAGIHGSCSCCIGRRSCPWRRRLGRQNCEQRRCLAIRPAPDFIPGPPVRQSHHTTPYHITRFHGTQH